MLSAEAKNAVCACVAMHLMPRPLSLTVMVAWVLNVSEKALLTNNVQTI